MHSGTRFKGFFNLDELFFRTTVKKLISEFFFTKNPTAKEIIWRTF